MNIRTENDRAYIVECNCSHVFDHNGRSATMNCPNCGAEEDTMTVVSRWWATAGWPMIDLPLLAPALGGGASRSAMRAKRAA